jgi:hypothetical protein
VQLVAESGLQKAIKKGSRSLFRLPQGKQFMMKLFMRPSDINFVLKGPD